MPNHRFELLDNAPPIHDDGRAEFRVLIVPLLTDGSVDASIPKHCETVYCPEHADASPHTKACVRPLMLAREKDDQGAEIPGSSSKEKAEAWLADQRTKRAGSKAGKVTVTDRSVNV